MPSVSLIPFANRFFPQVIDCNSDGVIAYGSRSNIILLDTKQGYPLFKDIIRKVHLNKVTSVSFCKNRKSNLLASIGEDLLVKVWDISHVPVCIHEVETTEFSNVVEWRYQDNLIFFPCDGTTIIKWLFKTNHTKRMKSFSQSPVQILAANPVNTELLAIGHRGGTISVVNINNESLCHRLRAHTLDITSFSWSHINPDTLLSVSKDYTIRLWALGEPNPIFTHNGTPRKSDDYNNKYHPWLCAIFHPSDPDVIVCATVRGEVGQIRFKEQDMPKFHAFSVKEFAGHHKHALHLVSIPSHQDASNIICSYGSDFQMVFWDVDQRKSTCALPTIGGFIYDLSFSPIDAGRLAIASADSSIRVWNVSCPTNKFSIKAMWQSTRGKIMVLAWHPTKENLLAFGTDEGRIGIADVLTYKKLNANSIFETHHGSSVYSLSWGPCAKAHENSTKLLLYSCGGGKIFVHNPNAVKTVALNFLDLIDDTTNPNAQQQNIFAEICWKPDFSCVAVGKNDGFVNVYSGQTFELLAQLFAQKKQVQSLVWHPMFTSLSQDQSQLHTWLACSSNDTAIQVYDLRDVLSLNNDKNASESIVYKSTRQLSGHTKRVVSLCWSPHIEGQLASASFDGTVQVWNVLNGQPIVNFRNHMECVQAVQWSLLDPDVLYSGGEDNAVLCWKISEQTETMPPTKCLVKRQTKKRGPAPVGRSFQVAEENDVTPSKSEIKEKSEKPSGDEIEFKNGEEKPSEENIIAENHATSTTAVQTKTIENEPEKKPVGQKPDRKNISNFKKGLFPEYSSPANSSKEKNLGTCKKLVDIMCAHSLENGEPDLVLSNISVEEDINLGFFTDQSSALALLDIEANNHRGRGAQDCALHLEFWKGNVKGALTEAADRGELNEFLVSLAPLASRSLWLEMCEKYAMQLISKKYYGKAAQYLLACNKLYQAIDAVADQGHIRDAVALAKARLPDSDPVITQLLQKWASKSLFETKYTQAAECFLALKQPLQAAKTLCKAADCESAEAAAYICRKLNLKEADHFSLLCLKKCLLQDEWQTARSLSRYQPNGKMYGIVIAVHESLSSHVELFKPGSYEQGVVPEVFPKNPINNVIFWKGFTIGQDSYLRHLHLSLKSQGLIPSEKEDLMSLYKDIHNIFEAQYQPKSEEEALFIMTFHCIECLILVLIDDLKSAQMHLVNVLNVCFKYENLFNSSFQLFFPSDFFWFSNTNNLGLTHLGNGQKSGDTEFELIATFAESFLNQNIFSSEALCTNLVFDGENILDFQSAVDMLSKATAVDCLLAYFSISVIRQLTKLVVDNNLRLPCLPITCVEPIVAATPPSDSFQKDTTDEDSIIDRIQAALKEADEKIKMLSAAEVCKPPNDTNSYVATEVPNECCDKTKPSSEDLDIPDLNDQIQMAMAESTKDMKIAVEKMNKICSTNVCESSNDTNSYVAIEVPTECCDKTEPSSEYLDLDFPDLNDQIKMVMEESAKALEMAEEKMKNVCSTKVCEPPNDTNSYVASEVQAECCDKTNPFSESLIIPDLNESRIKMVVLSEKWKQKHNKCLKVVQLFHNLITFLTSYTCREVFVVKYFLQDLSSYLEASIASAVADQRLKKNQPTDDCEQSVTEYSNDAKAESAKSEDVFVEDGTPDLVQTMQQNHQKYSKILSSAEELTKNLKYPNALEAAAEMTLLCSEVLKRSACEANKKILHDYIHSICSWADRFSREGKPYVTCSICRHLPK